jgi:hypothetical protein
MALLITAKLAMLSQEEEVRHFILAETRQKCTESHEEDTGSFFWLAGLKATF